MKIKDEKDIEILRQLKGKSTFLTDSSVVAKAVAENVDDQGYEETHPRRLELPVFSGDNPCDWLHRAEQYFHFTNIGYKDNFEAAMCLDGIVSDLQRSLVEFKSLFEDPTWLPLSRSHNHTLQHKEGSQLPNIRSYCYPHYWKNETEHIVKEMMARGTIKSNTSPISSLVFHV
ncbi:hypothetical protein V6N12_029052 [Hibiscus sabdariffa]|uniref:Glycosyltransferase n=1 Tax=Hibiscus sabdariffa TaxID=183260 RepID=A0ABR2F7K8_9ROSI